MPTEQLTPPDLLLHLRYVVLEVRKRLQGANLVELSSDTGISISNLRRLRSGGTPNLKTLELLAYFYGPKPEPKPLEVSRLPAALNPFPESALWNPEP